jgi:ppGpp synthetase/RelA/SpoT-type nucleotidyltranferase
MAKLWTVPSHTKGRMDWAGDTLIGGEAWLKSMDYMNALQIINNWRSAHSYPLQALTMTLRTRARNIDRSAIIAQRLKRLTSIAAKLRRNKTMQLSQMQDIGGCRAVVHDMKQVEKLVGLYEKSWAKNPKVRAEFVKKFDYVSSPKVDGYRGVHLIYKCRSKSSGTEYGTDYALKFKFDPGYNTHGLLLLKLWTHSLDKD